MKVGVIGVGSMGQHHARVYSELPETVLAGVADVDSARATEIAVRYGTTVLDLQSLLERVDAVSIAVPTRYHHQIASECIERGVDVLIEKPFVSKSDDGAALIERANENDVTIQVGHVERFNPAVLALYDIVADLDIVSVCARRLNPPPERGVRESAVLDLMIHDIDIVFALLDGSPTRVNAVGVRQNDHATATIQFPTDAIATLTASRIAQQKTRTLEITTRDCSISVDYLDQSIRVHGLSESERGGQDGDIPYRGKRIIERPMVGDEEPLKKELQSFVDAVVTGTPPRVTGEQGLRAVRLANRIDALARPKGEKSKRVTG